MATTYDDSLEQIARLVKQFQTNSATYLAPAYNEAQARQQLIDPLFIALGWDVHNEQHAAPSYMQVEVETRQTVSGHKRAPDAAWSSTTGG